MELTEQEIKDLAAKEAAKPKEESAVAAEAEAKAKADTEAKAKEEELLTHRPGRAERRIKQLVGDIKDLRRENERLRVEREGEDYPETRATEKPINKPKGDDILSRRVERLEQKEIRETKLADLDEQMDGFQADTKMSDRDMDKLTRIIRAESLIDPETNDIDFKSAMKILTEERNLDETEWKAKFTTSRKVTGPASSGTVEKPTKPPAEMSEKEIRQKGQELIPDN